MFKNVFILKFTLFMFPQVKTPFSPSQKKPILQLPKYEKLESQKMAHPITQPTKVLQNSPPPSSPQGIESRDVHVSCYLL